MTSFTTQATLSVKGQIRSVSAIPVGNVNILVSRSGLLQAAIVQDEDYVIPSQIPAPPVVLQAVQAAHLNADVVLVGQDFRNPQPLYPDLPRESDNVAAVPLSSYEQWLAALSQPTRRNIRLAEKRGVEIKVEGYSEEFARGIKEIYDESPVRQGRKFWHYDKSLQAVYEENGTYQSSSDYLAAYCDSVMIGFIKVVYVGNVARIMQILGMTAHFDKKPMFALMAKAVERACQKGATHLTYCKYTYEGQEDTSIAEFKRRLGFIQFDFPMYVLPVSVKGRLGVRLGAHRGLRAMLPRPVAQAAAQARNKICSWLAGRKQESFDGGQPRN